MDQCRTKRVNHVTRGATLAGICQGLLPVTLAAQPCNPVIDGTYCASQPIRRSDTSARDTNGTPMIGMGRDLALSRDEPVTFGAATFSKPVPRGKGTP
jgi:hypothetical protein